MKRLSIFHSTYGAAALAMALSYSWGQLGYVEFAHRLRPILRGKGESGAFLKAKESVLVARHGTQEYVFRRAINSVITGLNPDIELVFYTMPDVECMGDKIALWLLSRGFLPQGLVDRLCYRIWKRVVG